MSMTEADYNANIKLTPYDPLLAKTVLRLIPPAVRPNHVTVVRFLTSPLVWWLLWQGWYRLGLLAFIMVAFTDALDGTMARIRKQITLWGITYDGVADKVLIGGVVLVMVVKHLGLTLAGVILGLEVLGLLGALYFKRKGIIHPANWWGKIKMNLQVLATVFLLIKVIWGFSAFTDISYTVFASSLVFGLASIISHVLAHEHA